MGYHVILRITEEGLDSRYVETLDELRNFPELTKETIIYQGEAHWTPIQLGDNEACAVYAESNYRLGRKTEILFQEMCTKHGLIMEALSQTQESFRCYTRNVDVSIKRGDFLIRNAGNLEVDVKCRKKGIHDQDGYPFYFLNKEDVKRHTNMERFTNCPVLLAFFERDGEDPVEESLCMMAISEIVANEKDIQVKLP